MLCKIKVHASVGKPLKKFPKITLLARSSKQEVLNK